MAMLNNQRVYIYIHSFWAFKNTLMKTLMMHREQFRVQGDPQEVCQVAVVVPIFSENHIPDHLWQPTTKPR